MLTNDFDGLALEVDDESDYTPTTGKWDADQKANELGLALVVPDDRTLTVDFDQPVAPATYFETIKFLETLFPIEEQKVTISKSGNLHFYVRMKDSFSALEKVALQALLGSDPKREALSLKYLREGGTQPASVMFEKKKAA